MDWKETLGNLLADGSLPEGEDINASGRDSIQEEDTVASGVQREPLHIVMEKKGRGGKTATIIEGFVCDEATLRDVARRLKQSLGLGGSARGDEILIQGDAREKLRPLLRSMGYRIKG